VNTPSFILDISEGFYGSQNDEAAFFEWLDKIECVSGYRGMHEGGSDLVRVELTTDEPNEADLRDLIALHHRFGREMGQLAQFRTEQNEGWFADPIMYWHEAVFRPQAAKV
jgi:hypothetical protein